MSPAVPMMGVPGCCDCSDDEDDCEAMLTVTVFGPCEGDGYILGATVELYDGATLIDSGTTDANGQVVLGPLSSSAVTYDIEVSAPGFVSDSDTYISSGCSDGGKSIGLTLAPSDYHLCCDCDRSIAIGDTRTLSGDASGTLTWGTVGTQTGWIYCTTLSASDRVLEILGPLCASNHISGDVPILFVASCSGLTIWFPTDLSSVAAGTPNSWPAADFDTDNGNLDCSDVVPGTNVIIGGDCARAVFIRNFPGQIVASSCDPYSHTLEMNFEITEFPNTYRHPLYYIFGPTATFTVG
jgi:hypothetical protein